VKSSKSNLLGWFHETLSLQARIVILCGILSLPALIILMVLTYGNLAKINVLNREIQGVHDLKPLWAVMLATPDTPANPATIEAIKTRFAHAPYLMDVGFPKESTEVETIRETALGLFDTVLTKQNLILDDDQKGYFTIVAVYDHLPNLIEASNRFSNAQAYDEEARLASEIRLLANLDSMERAFEKASSLWFQYPQGRFIDPLSAELSQAVRQFQETPNPATLKSIQSIADKLYAQSSALVEQNLAQRRFNLFVYMWSQIAICVGIIILGALMAYKAAKGFSKRIFDLSRLLDRMKNDEPIEFVPYQTDQNETGIMARAIYYLRTQLVAREIQKVASLQAQKEAEQKQLLLGLAAQFETSIAALIDDVAGSTSELTYLSNDMNKVVTEAGKKHVAPPMPLMNRAKVCSRRLRPQQ